MSEELFENVSGIKHLCVDILSLGCIDVAQISFKAFEMSQRLETATPNDKKTVP